MLKSSLKNLTFCIQRTITRKLLTSSAENDLFRIPHNSSLLIGGFLTNEVPSNLLNMLLKANVFNLTLITNASVLHNKELKALLKTEGKVKRLITSLESNLQAVHDSELKHYFELVPQKSGTFIKNYCFQDLNDSYSSVGDYALVKTQYIDNNNNLLWKNNSPTFYNDSFAQSAKYFAIAEGAKLNRTEDIKHNSMYQIKTNGVFVQSVYLYEDEENFKEEQATVSLDRINYDLAYEKIIKRLQVEFADGDKIVISDDLKFLVQSLYFPKHIKVNIMSPSILEKWPSNFEWLNLVQKLDVCVVHTDNVNENGDVSLRNRNLDECLVSDIMNNIGQKTKIIAVMKLSESKINSAIEAIQACKCKVDLLITDRCVFKLNKFEKKLELIEFTGDLIELKNIFEQWNFQPLVSRNILKTIRQECF